MRDRLSSFSDPEIINLLKTRFVSATDNDWYNRRRQDEVGRFFQSVVNQDPWPAKSHTKQGHYIFTASGILLGFNNNRDKVNRMRFIRNALAKWDALPDKEKTPGGIQVPALSNLKLDGKFHTSPPAGSVVLIASSRILKWNDKAQLAACEADDHPHPWGHLAAIDRMWIQQSEWAELIEAGNQNGAIPNRLAKRLARFHLLDLTRGEPQPWKLNDIRTIETRIEKASDSTYQLIGKFVLRTTDDQRGFEAALRGTIAVNPKTLRPESVKLTVLGDHWGDGIYTKGARPGRNPLGIAFRLADMTLPENQIRPQQSHWLQAYWEAEIAH